jgi:hypothetical protein
MVGMTLYGPLRARYSDTQIEAVREKQLKPVLSSALARPRKSVSKGESFESSVYLHPAELLKLWFYSQRPSRSSDVKPNIIRSRSTPLYTIPWNRPALPVGL